MSSKIKQIILGILTIAVGFFGWSSLSTILVRGASFSGIGIFCAFFLIALGILFSFCALFIEERCLFFLVSAVLAILPFLIFERNYYFLIGAALFFLASVYSGRRFRREKAEYLKFRFWRVASRGLPIFLTGSSLILAIIFAFSPQVSKIAIEIPRPIFDSSFGILSKIINWQFYPGFHPEITVDEFLKLFLSKQIEALRESPQYAKLPKQLVEKELLEEQKQKLSKNLETEISGKEKVKDILYQLVNKNLPSLIKPYQEFLPPAFIVLGFLW